MNALIILFGVLSIHTTSSYGLSESSQVNCIGPGDPSQMVITSCRVAVALGVGITDTICFSISNFEAYPNATVRFRIMGHDTSILYASNETFILNAEVQTVPVMIKTLRPGVTTVTIKIVGNDTDLEDLNLHEAFVTVSIYEQQWLVLFSTIAGYLYTLSWSLSFYPQIYSNWKRKSVVGLNFDFIAFNILGFVCYSANTASLYFNYVVQREFFEAKPHKLNQTELNDVVFCFDAVFATLITIGQCFIYDRGGQKMSKFGKLLVTAIITAILIHLILVISNVLIVHPWFTFVDMLGNYKMLVSFIKYIPQALSNYRRKSTSGWSIENVLCDLTGGFLSLLQLAINCYNFDNWPSMFSNPTKIGLSLITIVFDFVFIVQHYCLYRHSWKDLDENNDKMAAADVNKYSHNAKHITPAVNEHYFNNGGYQDSRNDGSVSITTSNSSVALKNSRNSLDGSSSSDFGIKGSFANDTEKQLLESVGAVTITTQL